MREQRTGPSTLHPRLKRWFQVTPDGDRIILSGSERMLQLRSGTLVPVLERLLPLLDGSRTIDELREALPDVEPETLDALLARLERADLIEEPESPSALLDERALERYAAQLTWFSQFDGSAQQRQEALAAARVSVIGLDTTGSAIAASLLQAGVGDLIVADEQMVTWADIGAGYRAADVGRARAAVWPELGASINPDAAVRVWEDGLDRDLTPLLDGMTLAIVVGSNGPPGLLPAVNRAALDTGTRWLLCGATSREASVGPIFYPPYAACYECYRTRLYSNLATHEERRVVDRHAEATGCRAGSGALAPLSAFVGGMAAFAATQLISGLAEYIDSPGLYGCEFVLDLTTWRGELHPVLRVPRCPVCSAVARRPEVRPWL